VRIRQDTCVRDGLGRAHVDGPFDGGRVEEEDDTLQFLRCQYLYFCPSKESKLSTFTTSASDTHEKYCLPEPCNVDFCRKKKIKIKKIKKVGAFSYW
jgi:hypothetical protein